MQLISYIRVSGKGQLDGDGPDRQRDTIKEFCARYKITLLSETFEKAISGGREAMDRPAFIGLLSEVICRRKNGCDVDGIVVERADRLARDLLVSEMLLKECRQYNLKVFCADRGELVDIASDQADPTQILVRQVLAALSQWEKSNLVMKLRKARERVRFEGRKCEGRTAFGAKSGEQTIIDSFKSLLEQGMSDNRITRLLNEMELSNRFGKWNRYSVLRLRHKVQKGLV